MILIDFLKLGKHVPAVTDLYFIFGVFLQKTILLQHSRNGTLAHPHMFIIFILGYCVWKFVYFIYFLVPSLLLEM